jgi:hypothetical protein
MIVETMSPSELSKAIIKDLIALKKSTLLRLAKEYDKLRSKKKISKEASFHQVYEIKSAAKNKWICFFSKSPIVSKYQSFKNITYTCITYYYTSKGLRVIRLIDYGTNEILNVYNGHFFTRYNERMKLNLKQPLDIVKHFFIHNCYGMGRVIENEGREYTLSKCTDGFMLGELQNNRQWWVEKTFISNDMKREDQSEKEKEFIGRLNFEVQMNLQNETYNQSQKRRILSIQKSHQG